MACWTNIIIYVIFFFFFLEFIRLTNLFFNLFNIDDSYKINYKYSYISKNLSIYIYIYIYIYIHNFVKMLTGTTCINYKFQFAVFCNLPVF